MKLLMYLFLGVIQGFTEPIPVSSSGHLVIFSSILNIDTINDLNFEIFVNFGSFIAISYYYRKDIVNIIMDFFSYIKYKDKKYKDNYHYAWLIFIASIPVGIIGLMFKSKIESLTSVKLVGISLLITAFMLFLVKDIKGNKKKEDMNIIDALVVGLFQVIALFPGISRSGSTLVGGLMRGLEKNCAFKFSFMLYLPISIATMVLSLKDILSFDKLLIIPYTLGMVIATIVTYYSLKWFSKVLKEGKIMYFVYYCLIVGLLTILFL